MKHLMICIAAMVVLSSIVYAEPESKKTKQEEPSRHDSIYYFQHRLLPRWVHNSKGRFFSDLKSGIPPHVTKKAEEIVDAKFVESFKLKALPNKNAYVVIFEQPTEVTECYYVIIKKEGNGYKYYTLEKALDMFKKGNKSVVGKWSKDGTHGNLGTRKYDDMDSFIKDVLTAKTDG